MSAITESPLRKAESSASSLACLSALVAEALAADPATSIAAEAVDGLSEMAADLSRRLHDLAEKAEPARDPLLSYLCTRNLLMRQANDPIVSPARSDELSNEAGEIEQLIVGLPAVTIEGFAAKMMLTVQGSLEGFEMSAAQAQAMIREGRDAFGIGDFITSDLEQENAA